MKKILAALLLLSLVAGCGSDAPTDPEDDGKTICIGVFRLTKGSELQQWTELYMNQHKVFGVDNVRPVGVYAERVKVKFLTEQYMWKFLKK